MYDESRYISPSICGLSSPPFTVSSPSAYPDRAIIWSLASASGRRFMLNVASMRPPSASVYLPRSRPTSASLWLRRAPTKCDPESRMR